MKALKIKKEDNVATALEDLAAGEEILLAGTKLKVLQDIPYGHKVAAVDIAQGANILKYGEVIGRATASIPEGTHVHVHNVESLRGRGDWRKD